MKRKKRILESIVTIIFVVVITIPFMVWNKLDKIESRFNEIESGIFINIPAKQIDKPELIITYCDTVSRFISDNPIEMKVDLNCSDYNLLDSARIDTFRADFILKVHKISNDYKSQERVANRFMFFIFGLSIIVLGITRKIIDNRFKAELIDKPESSEKGKS